MRLETNGAKELLVDRIQCMRDIGTALDIDLDFLEESRVGCCQSYSSSSSAPEPRRLTITGINPAMPELIEAGVRYGKARFTQDGTEADGQPTCYYDGTRWTLWHSFDYLWVAESANENSPDLASGWTPVDLAQGIPVIVIN